MKPILALAIVVSLACATAPAKDLKKLLSKAMFAEEVDQNPDQAAQFYRQLIEQATQRPKHLAIARYRLACLLADKGRKDEALALLRALVANPESPDEFVARARDMMKSLAPAEARPRRQNPRSYPAHLRKLLCGKTWDWHAKDYPQKPLSGSIRFLPNGNLEATSDMAWLRSWAPFGENRFVIRKADGMAWVFEMAPDGRRAASVKVNGFRDDPHWIILHPDPSASIEKAEFDYLGMLLEKAPDKLADWGIPAILVTQNSIKSFAFLFDHGVPVDIREPRSWHWTPLMFAVQQNKLDMASFLLDRGADVNALDIRKAPPLFIAARDGLLEMATLLLDRGADIHIMSSRLDPGDKNYDLGTALHQAAMEGHLQLARLLLDRGAEINAVSPERKHTPLICALAKQHFKLARKLLDRGADPNLPQPPRWNPLHQMAIQGNSEITRLLLAHGAKLDLQSTESYQFQGFDWTTGGGLHVAAREGYLDVARILVEAGCPVDLKSPRFRETPLHVAALGGNAAVAKWLLDHGADPGSRMAEGIGRPSGWTPMHSGAWRGSVEIVRLLMKHGQSAGEPCGEDGLRRTPLHIACRGWLPAVRTMLEESRRRDPDSPKRLLRLTDSHGDTPLHFAVSKEATPDLALVRFLISQGAPLDVRNKKMGGATKPSPDC